MPYKLILLETARKLAEQHDFDGQALREAIPYLQAFQGRKFVLKIGGSVLQDELLIPSLVSDVAFLKRLDINVILVHGGARQLDRRMQARGLQPSKRHGLRVTSAEALELANEVFLEISRVIVDAVAQRGYEGVIFDRASGLVRSRQKNPELGYVGEPVSVDASRFEQLPATAIPIVTAITSGLQADEPGYNVNADEVASAIAREIRAGKLILMTDEDGVKDEQWQVVADSHAATGRDSDSDRSDTRRHDPQGAGLSGPAAIWRQQVPYHQGGRRFLYQRDTD